MASHSTWTRAIFLLHLGAVLDSVQGLLFLSLDRQSSIRDMVTKVLAHKKVSLLLLSQLFGKLILCIAIVPWPRIHLRHLQWFLLPFQKQGRGESLVKVKVLAELPRF